MTQVRDKLFSVLLLASLVSFQVGLANAEQNSVPAIEGDIEDSDDARRQSVEETSGVYRQFIPDEITPRPGDDPTGVRNRTDRIFDALPIRHQMTIVTVAPPDCVLAGQQFTLFGQRFEDTQGTKSVFLSRSGVDTHRLEVIEWSDTRIVVRVPTEVSVSGIGERNVGIKNDDNRYISNTNKVVKICDLRVVPSRTDVVINTSATEFPEQCFPINLDEVDVECSGPPYNANCTLADSERVVYQSDYALRSYFYEYLFYLLDNELDAQCLGPVGVTRLLEDGTTYTPMVVYYKNSTTGRIGPPGDLFEIVSCTGSREGQVRDWVHPDTEVRMLDDGNWGIGQPEVHRGREFWFNVFAIYPSEHDARWAVDIVDRHDVKWTCGGDFGFRYWARFSTSDDP